MRELLFVELDGVSNVVPIIDRGEWDVFWVLVMPRAEKSLRTHLVQIQDRLSALDALPILVQIAQALVAIEGRGVVHRDIKPENVLLLENSWCLADFGIARYAEATTTPDTLKYAMTAAYAAPEQWRAEQATSATDVYAFGVVAYELLAGIRPFTGPDYRSQHLEDSVERISGIPTRLHSLIEECLYKSPQARPFPIRLLTRIQSSIRQYLRPHRDFRRLIPRLFSEERRRNDNSLRQGLRHSGNTNWVKRPSIHCNELWRTWVSRLRTTRRQSGSLAIHFHESGR